MNELEKRFTFSLKLCQLAGSMIMDLRDKTWNIEYKGSQLKIEADILIEKFLIDEINKAFPSDIIISEEKFEIEPIKEPYQSYWLIDPIDGTSSFVKGFKGFCCQIAYIVDGKVMFGIVNVPAYEKMYFAKKNEGAFLIENGVERKLLTNTSTKDLTYIDNVPIEKNILIKFEKLGINNYFECGSFGVKLCFIAEGKADILFKPVEFKIWDTAPGGLILREAGGDYRIINGEEINYDLSKIIYHGLLAASSSELLNKLNV